MDDMAIYGYARVSTTRQAYEGESLEVKRRQIEGYALMHGMTIDRSFIERGVSGSKPISDRPEGAALMERLAARRYDHHTEAGPHVPLGA